MRIRGYFSKPTGVHGQKRLANPALLYVKRQSKIMCQTIQQKKGISFCMLVYVAALENGKNQL